MLRLTLGYTPSFKLKEEGGGMMRIGAAAKQVGISIDAIRYYEREGLIIPAAILESGYREFNDQNIETLRFIQRAKTLGFSLREIRNLLKLKNSPDTTCGKIKALATEKREQIARKIAALEMLRTDLDALLQACNTQEGAATECPIINSLDGHNTKGERK